MDKRKLFQTKSGSEAMDKEPDTLKDKNLSKNTTKSRDRDKWKLL